MYEAIGWVELIVNVILDASLLITTLLMPAPSAAPPPFTLPVPEYVAAFAGNKARANAATTDVVKETVFIGYGFADLLIALIMPKSPGLPSLTNVEYSTRSPPDYCVSPSELTAIRFVLLGGPELECGFSTGTNMQFVIDVPEVPAHCAISQPQAVGNLF